MNSVVTGRGRPLVVGMAAHLATTLPLPPLPHPGRSSEPRALVTRATIAPTGHTLARNTPGRMMCGIVQISARIDNQYGKYFVTGKLLDLKTSVTK